MEPNKERIGILVNWLRTRDLDQTRGQLRDGNSFCCLGVACEVYHVYAQDGVWVMEDGSQLYFRDHTDARNPRWDNSMAMPEPVFEWFGLSLPNPEIRFDYETRDGETSISLAGMNDEGFTFKQIADVIAWAYL